MPDSNQELHNTTDSSVDTAAASSTPGAVDTKASTKTKKPRNLDTASDSIVEHLVAKDSERSAGTLRGQRARSWTEKMLTRTTSGAVYAIAVVGCLFWGRVPTMVLVAAMAWLCCSEFYRISRMGGRMPNEMIGLSAAVLYPLIELVRPESIQAVTLLLILAAGCWYVLTPRTSISDVAVTVFGALYTGFCMSYIVAIRACDPGIEGALLTFGTMGSVWVSDAAAYFVGSRIGKNKLAPRISPNKSWEGFFGGLVGSVLIWLVLVALKVKGITIPLALVAGILCGVTGVMGDLFESRLKRSVGVKDSGNIMPGHGGLLDRSDSLLFACMTAYFVLGFGGIL